MARFIFRAEHGPPSQQVLDLAKRIPFQSGAGRTVTSWAAGTIRVLGQIKVDDKSHEITALPQLLRLLELSDCFVTVCAMGCQKKIARESRDADADYLLSLKANHETVHEEVETFPDDTVAEKSSTERPIGWKHSKAAVNLAGLKTVEKDHRRLETQRHFQSTELEWFADPKECNLWGWWMRSGTTVRGGQAVCVFSMMLLLTSSRKARLPLLPRWPAPTSHTMRQYRNR